MQESSKKAGEFEKNLLLLGTNQKPALNSRCDRIYRKLQAYHLYTRNLNFYLTRIFKYSYRYLLNLIFT